jgi:DNA-3-methyladenine glycosylase II
VLEQQVSLASARATFERLKAAVDTLTPKALMTLSPSQLRDVGFSRQKAAYARDLAAAILSGKLALPDLRNLSDHDARERLMSCRGIGPWTADIYLLMALRRPDVWPGHDLALAVAPWRAVAARILWHYYLRAGLNGRPRRDEPRTLHSHTS